MCSLEFLTTESRMAHSFILLKINKGSVDIMLCLYRTSSCEKITRCLKDNWMNVFVKLIQNIKLQWSQRNPLYLLILPNILKFNNCIIWRGEGLIYINVLFSLLPKMNLHLYWASSLVWFGLQAPPRAESS